MSDHVKAWTIEERIQRIRECKDIQDNATRRYKESEADETLFQEWEWAALRLKVAAAMHVFAIIEAYEASLPVQTLQGEWQGQFEKIRALMAEYDALVAERKREERVCLRLDIIFELRGLLQMIPAPPSSPQTESPVPQMESNSQ